MYARSNALMGNPLAMNDAVAYVHDEVMPLVQGMDGCVGLSMLCDRDSGRCVVTTAWANEEAMRASEAGVADSAELATHVFGGGPPEVRAWQMAVMHHAPAGHDHPSARVHSGEIHPAP